MHTFDVKKRVYYGNTSMESEISLLMANQTLVGRMLCTTRYAEKPTYSREGEPREADLRSILRDR